MASQIILAVSRFIFATASTQKNAWNLVAAPRIYGYNEERNNTVSCIPYRNKSFAGYKYSVTRKKKKKGKKGGKINRETKFLDSPVVVHENNLLRQRNTNMTAVFTR